MVTLVTIPTAIMQAAADSVVAAEAEVKRANAARDTADGEVETLRGRLADLEARRAEIVGRRQRGDCRDSDGADLALAGADSEGLQALLAEAETAAAPARQAAQAATNALAMARSRLMRTQDEAEEAALVEHARKLDVLVLSTISRIEELRQRLGRPVPPWGASSALRDALRRIALLRRE